MASLSSPELVPGSVASAYSIRDAIESYRRSQVMRSTSRVVSASYVGAAVPADERRQADDDEENVLAPAPGARASHEGFFSTLNWDDDDEPETWTYSTLQQPARIPSESVDGDVPATSSIFRGHGRVDERSPLLSEAPRRPELIGPLNSTPTKPGRSTFNQTFFNATALLLGIGMLSEPLAFSYAGWICGSLLIIGYGLITCYTAKYLAGVVISDSQVRTYVDIGKKAFGDRSMPLVNFLFCFETFSIGVVLITLYADSLSAIVPLFSPNTYKLLGLVVLIPSVFFPLSLLSYASLIGIVSTIFLIVVVFIDGLSKFDAPGSLWSPAKTSFGFDKFGELGLAFGLFMAGFGAHAALPSVIRDMAEPHRFNEAMNYSFAFATAVYALIGIGGYLMFGNDVYDEVSKNLLQVPGYNPVLNELALWMLVVTPLTKFALATRPINFAIESLCGLDTHILDDDLEADQKSPETQARRFKRSLKRILLVCERIAFVCLAVTVSILVPDFGSIMAILGSVTVFALCVIGPIIAKMWMERKATIVDVTILMSSIIMASWGTAAAVWSATR